MGLGAESLLAINQRPIVGTSQIGIMVNSVPCSCHSWKAMFADQFAVDAVV